MPAPDLVFRHADPEDEPGAALLRGMAAEIAELYEGLEIDAPDMPAAGPELLRPEAGGAFLLGWEGEQAICCGALKRLDDEACEVKRMFVAPDARGRGVARALLRALEDAARDLGYAVARLDTGPRQPHAQGLYEAEGYVAIANFNANPMATFFGEKRL
ncbi:GNAT family N-acetyltransferase [Conexibacter sp. SYSU D00693]|uniref:GNAT family N-acetyltransferase n=1 Tax=Conexibacter sp. SYSU D00693 TaxID=2812560 RepID=UPI00196B0782|nr:GNAT family N-acetyltransferase [Conexibacter sp. SYSU D00693]